MSGRRPDTTRVWEFVDNFRENGVGKNWTALPQWFKQNGYLSLGKRVSQRRVRRNSPHSWQFSPGGGKLFHRITPENDFPNSWTEQFPYFKVPQSDNYTCKFAAGPQSPSAEIPRVARSRNFACFLSRPCCQVKGSHVCQGRD